MYDRNRLFDNSEDYFANACPPSMIMDVSAASEVCSAATAKGLTILCIEGGIYHANVGRFEPRVTKIWDGNPKAISEADIRENNEYAKGFIVSRQIELNAFLVTTNIRSRK